MMEKDDRHMCPVCREYKFEFYNSSYECPICGWTDDAVQEDFPDWSGCSNDMSLNQARQAWKEGRRVE